MKKTNKSYLEYLKENMETSTCNSVLQKNNKKRKKTFWEILKSLLRGK
tara:strand:- start:1183 stop:1326 length:144 start_codon:yes stop_codon:yes gene_type:complete